MNQPTAYKYPYEIINHMLSSACGKTVLPSMIKLKQNLYLLSCHHSTTDERFLNCYCNERTLTSVSQTLYGIIRTLETCIHTSGMMLSSELTNARITGFFDRALQYPCRERIPADSNEYLLKKYKELNLPKLVNPSVIDLMLQDMFGSNICQSSIYHADMEFLYLPELQLYLHIKDTANAEELTSHFQTDFLSTAKRMRAYSRCEIYEA